MRMKYETVTYRAKRPVQHYTALLSVDVSDSRRSNESGKPLLVWIAETASEQKDCDLGEILDYLLVGTFEYFGQDTGKAIRRGIKADDPRLTELRETHQR